MRTEEVSSRVGVERGGLWVELGLVLGLVAVGVVEVGVGVGVSVEEDENNCQLSIKHRGVGPAKEGAKYGFGITKDLVAEKIRRGRSGEGIDGNSQTKQC